MKLNEDQKGQLMGLRRGYAVLEVLSRRTTGCTFSELQEALDGLPSPTLSRLLKVLLDMELIEKDVHGNRYGAGGKLTEFARALLGALPRESLVKPVLDALAEQSGESAAYFEIDGDDIVLREKTEQAESFHYMPRLGRNQIFLHGFLQAIVPFLKEGELLPFVERSAGMGIANKEWFRRIRLARDEHYYLDDGESNANVVRVTAPVFLGEGGAVTGSIGITMLKGPRSADKLDRCIELVRHAGRQATLALQS